MSAYPAFVKASLKWYTFSQILCYYANPEHCLQRLKRPLCVQTCMIHLFAQAKNSTIVNKLEKSTSWNLLWSKHNLQSTHSDAFEILVCAYEITNFESHKLIKVSCNKNKLAYNNDNTWEIQLCCNHIMFLNNVRNQYVLKEQKLE